MRKNILKIIVIIGTFGLIIGNSIPVNAAVTENSIGMYDGRLIAYADARYGKWYTEAEYTGYNPLGLKALLLQSQVYGKDGITRLFDTWAGASANGNIWFANDGGSNAMGAYGRNYARAIGYYWSGGDRRVATSYI